MEKVTQAFPNAWIYHEFLMVAFGTKSIQINKNMFKSIFWGTDSPNGIPFKISCGTCFLPRSGTARKLERLV